MYEVDTLLHVPKLGGTKITSPYFRMNAQIMCLRFYPVKKCTYAPDSGMDNISEGARER